MLFQSKRKKITQYLAQKKETGWSAFDELLQDWATDAMVQRLQQTGMTAIEIHIDWTDAYRCIDVQGKYGPYFVNLQIEPQRFLLAMGADEPDEPDFFPLESGEQVYALLGERLNIRA